MAASLATLLVDRDKVADLVDVYDLFGSLLGFPVALQPGSPIAAVLTLLVGFLDDDIINPIVLPALRAQFGDSASGDWLTLLAAALWRRPRIEQQAGTMTVVLENRGSFTGSLPIVRVKSSVTGKTYTAPAGSGSLVAWTGDSAYPTVTVTVTADQAGSSSNAQPGDVAIYPVALTAGPVNVFAQSNTACLGTDDEGDPQLLARGRAAVAELSIAGPVKGLVGLALDPTGSFQRRLLTPPWTIPYVPAIARVRVVNTGNATAAVYLASSSGPAAGTSSTPGTDVYNVAVAVRLFGGAAGITYTIAPASAHTIALGTITLAVDSASNVTAAEAVAAAQTALAAFFAVLPIGGSRKVAGGTGYVYADKVRGVLEAPSYVVEADMTYADTALAVGDVAVPTYTIAANIVDQT